MRRSAPYIPWGALAQETFDGTVAAGETVAITAPFGGTVTALDIREGQLLEAGDAVVTLSTTKVWATQDGTVNGVFAQEGDSAEGVMEKVPVEIGVDNDNYVEITAGLSEGDKVYAEETASASASTGLSSLMSLFGGGSMPGGSAPSGMQNSRQNRDFGGDFGGGSFGGGFGGGMP